MSAPLRLSGVGVVIGGSELLADVSLEVPPGRIVAVIGPNGAGKTTLLDAVSGMVRCTGAVEIDGSRNGHRIGQPRRGVGRVFQGSPLPETLTVAEVLELVAGSRDAAFGLLDRFGLRPHATSFVAELSTGMRRILDLAVATVGSPAVLLLDEPASGLAQSEVELLAELIVAWRDETGAAVVLVEHDAWLIRTIADEVVALEGGRVVARGSSRKVLAKPRKGVRLHSPQEERFREALAGIADGAA
ncbi:MAG: ATP-binding cassette domain-containing protein, partial [Actinomycetota bacterium]